MKVYRNLLKSLSVPLAAPSANISSKLSPTSAEDVFDEFKNKIGFILNGGKCDFGIESTIVDLTSKLSEPESVDAVLTFRNLHNWLGPMMDKVFSNTFAALKSGGIFGIVEHRALKGTSMKDMKKIVALGKYGMVAYIFYAIFHPQ